MREALDQDKPVFGVCLGAQMMATALGGVVEPSGGYQIGLKKISVTADGKTDPVFHNIEIPLVPTLHGDTFSIPEGAVKLADAFMLRRDGTYRRINMAFRYGRSYAFQFEPQLTLEEFRSMGPRTTGRLPVPGKPIRSRRRSGSQPPRVCRIRSLP